MAKEKTVYHAELDIRASMLSRVVKAFKELGFTHSGGILVEFYKRGIVLRMESNHELVAAVAISSKALPSYKCNSTSFRAVLNFDNVMTLKSWSEGKKESIPLTIKFLDSNITMKYTTLNGRTKHEYFPDVLSSVEGVSKSASESMAHLNELCILKSEDLVFVVERIARLKPDEYAPDYSRLESDGKNFALYRELGQGGDEAEVLFTSIKKKAKARKETDHALFETKALANLVTGFCPLTKEVTLLGGTDKPLALTGSGTPILELQKFEHDMDYCVVLAPKIEG